MSFFCPSFTEIILNFVPNVIVINRVRIKRDGMIKGVLRIPKKKHLKVMLANPIFRIEPQSVFGYFLKNCNPNVSDCNYSFWSIWSDIQLKSDVHFTKKYYFVRFYKSTKMLHISDCYTLSNFFSLLAKNSNLKRIHFSLLSYAHRNSRANECYRTYVAVHIYMEQ